MGVKKTYIINIDGARADYIGVADQDGCLTETITVLAKGGYLFSCCFSEMPSNTGTNHTSIITGAHPGKHGILGVGGCYKGLDFNKPGFSKKYGTIITDKYTHDHCQVPTFFNIIKKNNPDLITAFIPGKTWLGNILSDEDCDITIFPANTPDNCMYHKPNPSYVSSTEGYVLGGLANIKVNEIPPRIFIPDGNGSSNAPPGTLNLSLVKMNADSLPSDKWIIDQSIQAVKHDDPDFMYIILMNIDLAGHAYGAFLTKDENQLNLSVLRNPDAMRDQLRLTDLQIKRFIDFLKENNLFQDSRIIITSDHGMNTTKSMIVRDSWKKYLKPIHRLRLFIKNWIKMNLKDYSIEHLDVDIRKILESRGIYMRASLKRWNYRYKKNGDYDWCFSDGGVVGCIFGVEETMQETIKEILLKYRIIENGKEINPIWMVLARKEMDEAINPYTGKKFKLGRGYFNDKYDAEWPDMLVFPDPHYMIPMYNDQLSAGLMPIMIQVQLPYFIDLRTSAGLHGTYMEQNVPLIFISKSEKKLIPYPIGTVVDKQVGVIDIIPTINHLNGWETQYTFDGTELFNISKAKKQ